jgi:hypothetical protein
MPRDMDEATRMPETMPETMAIAEPAAVGDQVDWKERSRALLLLFPAPPSVTTLPPCRHDALAWLM